jgi:Tfp pilus assembly protein PilF
LSTDKAIRKAYDRIFEGLLEMAKAFEREGKNEEALYRYSKALELTNRCCIPIFKRMQRRKV